MKESKGAHVLAPTPPPLPPPPVKTPSRDLTSTNVRKSSVKNGQRKVLEASSGDPVSFLEKRSLTKIYDLREMSLARAMRALDALRKHTSTRAEIEELGASERLDVQDRAGLFTLCGCKRGGRLTSEEMKKANRLTLDMADAYVRLEALFETLMPRIRQKSSETGVVKETSRDLERFFEVASEWLKSYEEVRMLVQDKRAEMSRLSSSAVGREEGTNTVVKHASPRDAEGIIETEQSRPFPDWLSTLMDLYRNAQEYYTTSDVRVGSGNVPPPAEGKPSPAAEEVANTNDSQGKVAYDCVVGYRGECIQRQIEMQTRVKIAPTVTAQLPSAAGAFESSSEGSPGTTRRCSPPTPAVDSLARFSRFLAMLVVAASGGEQHSGGGAWTTPRELEALGELVEASDDGSERGEAISSAGETHCEGPSMIVSSRGEFAREVGFILRSSPESPRAAANATARAVRPVRYWTRRLHRFLLSVRELRAVPGRDEGSCQQGFRTSEESFEDYYYEEARREISPPLRRQRRIGRTLLFSPPSCAQSCMSGDRPVSSGS